ncbi:MAG: GAF domain-containing sensor histidine kinase [Thermodesulfovibrionales bacterium]
MPFVYTSLFASGGEQFLIFRNWPQPGPLFHLVVIYFGINVIFGHILLVYKWFKVKENILKNQIIYVLIGGIFGFLGGSVNFLPWYKIAVLPVTTILVSLWGPIITYAILRYRLMDINVVIKRTTVYSLSAGLLGSFFVVFVLATTKYLTDYLRISSFAIMTIAAVVIAILFNPVRNRIQAMIDKIFYKKTYDYYSTIQNVSHELAKTFNPKRIYSFVGDTILTSLGLKNFYMLFFYPDEKYRVVYSISSGVKDKEKKEKMVIVKDSKREEPDEVSKIQIEEKIINSKSEVVNLLKKLNDVIVREELPQMPGISREVADKVNTELMPFKGEAVVPVFIDGKLELMMVLGEKQSGDIYTDEDVRLLNTISDQTAIAVKNAKLYLDKVRSERLASIGMISATFAHEIKNPLTSIKTFVQLLPERYSDTDFRENFSRLVIDGVNRIDGLIQDLLDFSSGKISVELNPVNVTEIMDKVVDEALIQIQLKNRKIEIEKDYKDIEIDMMGDSKRLRQAFINIILNACQAIPERKEDGKITVSINLGEENVGILIADNGEGIPPEDIPRIFEPFFSKKTVGAGLGLVITKKIIEDHYGKIEVDSILKKGTIFKITLPIKKMGAKVANLSTA